MLNKTVYMGTNVESWMSHKKIKYVTFNVTDDCNLACTYCYFTHKTNKRKMSFYVAQKAIDLILNNDDFLEYDGVVWDFIGGEPSLELDLIDKICDYILLQMHKLNHKWLYCYRFLIGSNGLLYSHPKFQKIIYKHGINLQVAITIDGSKEKHDLSRIKKGGGGSYDDVVKQIPLWQKQQGGVSTKATFSHDDLPYLKDSIVNLWNLGIKNVMANVVFEDVWHEGDDTILKNQLIDLADYIAENNLWYDYSVRFFNPNIGMPITETTKRTNFCGTGKMLAISTDGDFFPCVRFMDSAFNHHKGLSIGNINVGWNSNRIRAFKLLDANTISSNECLNCQVASGCNWCSGFNYDDSDIGTLFERKTYICKMHKATVEACKYLWSKYEEKTGELSPRRRHMLQNTSEQQKWLYILTDSRMTSFCNYITNNKTNSFQTMDDSDLEKALDFCEKYDYNPIFLGSIPKKFKKKGYTITDDIYDDLQSFSTCIIITHDSISKIKDLKASNVVLSETLDSLNCIVDDIRQLLSNKNILNINLFIPDFNHITLPLLDSYKDILFTISNMLAQTWETGHRPEINAITHILHYKYHKTCKAGTYNLTLGPDNCFYPCPAFYYEGNQQFAIGSIDQGLNNKYFNLCKIEKSKLCYECDANHCTKCIYLCKTLTNEFCVPPKELCVKSNIECEAARYFYNLIQEKKLSVNFDNPLTLPLEFLDPLSKLN